MVCGRNVREIFSKSLHRTDRLVYRLLTLHFVSFLTEISTRKLFTIANSNGGIYVYGCYASGTFCIAYPRILFAFFVRI